MLHIREASLEDAQGLSELYLLHLARTQQESPSKEDFLSNLNERILDPNYHILVGVIGRRVVASITLIIIKNLTHNLHPYALIENVVSHSDYRKRGYARSLMQQGESIAVKESCYKIMLMTGAKDAGTLCFYESCGYSKDEKTAFIKHP